MNKSIMVLVIALAGVAGCSTKKQAVDNTPLNPTVVLTANAAINGSVLPDSTGVQKVYTRPTLRRIDQTINYKNWMARNFLGNSDDGQIAVTEKNLSWVLNNKQKTYIECPLFGCSANLWKILGQQPEGEQEEDAFSPNTPETCAMTTKSMYDVIDKKVTREINGFSAHQYQLIWSVTNTDEQGRKDEHKVVMDFWMTAPTEAMKEAWKINAQFQDNYLQAVGANDSALGRFVGNQVYKSLAAVSGDIEKNPDMKALNGKLAALKGYPVSIKLEWYMSGNTCPEVLEKRNASKAGNDSELDFKDPVASLGNIAGGFLKNKAKDALKKKFKRDTSKPLIRYVYDVTSVTVEQKHDSIFMVPAGYKLTNRQ